MRNGYSPATVKTTAGPVTIQRLKLRGTTGLHLEAVRVDGDQVECAGVAGDRRVRPRPVGPGVASTLADALGAEAALSKSTV
jgi:putative transposase